MESETKDARMIGAMMLRLSLSSVMAAMPCTAPAPAHARSLSQAPVARARYLMGTVCEGTAYGEQAAAALDSSFDEIARLEGILSDYRADSELSRLNREAGSHPFACSPELYAVVANSARFSKITGGAFDTTVAPLILAWDLRGAGRVPAAPELQAARALVGSSLLLLDSSRRTVQFSRQGMAIDPGAIGKGFALDAAGRVLRSRGVTAALLDFGGQVLAIGAPPGATGWQVDIAHPARRDETALTIELADASASTSGSSERGVRVDGRLLSHIVDPRSGRPSGFRGSVTVISPLAIEADAFSTALHVMGPGAGLAWADARPSLRAVYLEQGDSGRLRVSGSRNFQGINPVRVVRAGDNRNGGN